MSSEEAMKCLLPNNVSPLLLNINCVYLPSTHFLIHLADDVQIRADINTAVQGEASEHCTREIEDKRCKNANR